jgi:hypothetical protein
MRITGFGVWPEDNGAPDIYCPLCFIRTFGFGAEEKMDEDRTDWLSTGGIGTIVCKVCEREVN